MFGRLYGRSPLAAAMFFMLGVSVGMFRSIAEGNPLSCLVVYGSLFFFLQENQMVMEGHLPEARVARAFIAGFLIGKCGKLAEYNLFAETSSIAHEIGLKLA